MTNAAPKGKANGPDQKAKRMTQRKSNTTLRVPAVKQEVWRQLYAAAFEYRSMEMWKTFSESDHFGFVHPDTGECYIGSILGELGKVFSLILYHGEEGLRFCRSAMELSDEEILHYLAFNMRCLMCDFVNKTKLHKEDKQVLESLQITVPRKRHMYPQFRAHRPVFVPWFIDTGEAEALRMGMVTAAKFCADYGTDEGIGRYRDLPSSHLPIYRLTGDDSESPASWTAEIEALPTPSETESPDALTAIPLDQVRRAHLKIAPLGQQDAVLQFDAFYLPNPVNEGFDRPRFVRVLLGVDAASGLPEWCFT
jgi:hypothetical protein